MEFMWPRRCANRRLGVVPVLGVLAVVVAVGPPIVMAAEWQPAANVELIVGASAGGGNDSIARTMEKIIHDRLLVKTSLSVVNKPGGGDAIAITYLNQHAGNPHYLSVSSNTLLTNYITGKSSISFRDVTPIAVMINEYIAFEVKADSTLKTGGDLAARLKAKPDSLVFGISSAFGNINHIAIATVAGALGVDAKKLRIVVFSGAGKSLTALLGGHVDIVAGPPSIATKYYEAGTLRALAVTSPHRLAGSLADIPTWKELGVNAEVVNWRGVVGPKGISDAQVAYWSQVFAKVAQSDEWESVVQKNHWESAFMAGKKAIAYMQAQNEKLKRVLMDLGLAR